MTQTQSAVATMTLNARSKDLSVVLGSVFGQLGYISLKSKQLPITLGDTPEQLLWAEWVRIIDPLEGSYPRFHIAVQTVRVFRVNGKALELKIDLEMHIDENRHQASLTRKARRMCKAELRRLDKFSHVGIEIWGRETDENPHKMVRLKEFCRDNSIEPPKFTFQSIDRYYRCFCQISLSGKEIIGYGTSRGKRDAREQSAAALLSKLQTAVRG